MKESDVLFEIREGSQGQLGLITLNRPQQINALTPHMCIQIRAQLEQWAKRPSIRAIVVQGAGDRGFCAGGDLRYAYDHFDTPEKNFEFFSEEYRLDHLLLDFPKPYVSLMHGITMGGGVGLCMLGHFRVAAHNLRLAMPETGIGYFTDVGATYFLTHARSHIGWYMGLTGAEVSAYDIYPAGMIDLITDAHQFSAIIQALCDAPWETEAKSLSTFMTHPSSAFALTAHILQSFAQPTPQAYAHEALATTYFYQPDSIESLFEALEKTSDPWCQQALDLLQKRSPMSLKVELALLKRGTELDAHACLAQEYKAIPHFLHSLDFKEGIRAAVIDKDRSPRWQFNDLAAITDQMVYALCT